MLARILVFFAFLCPLTSWAQESGLWSYSCDHFLYGACLRVPTGMSVTYEAPVDFGVHRVRRDDREVALIYEGDAPEKPASGSTPDLRFTDGGYVVSGYARAEGRSTRYDVYVRPGSFGAGSLHIRGSAATADELASLAAVVGGFRICNFQQSKRSQTLTCPRRASGGRDCRSGSCVSQRAGSRISHQASASRPEVSQRRNTAVQYRRVWRGFAPRG